MFVELNELKCLIIHVGQGTTESMSAYKRIHSSVKVVYLVDDNVWGASTDSSRTEIRRFDPGYIFPFQANIKKILDQFGFEPFQTVYLTETAEEVAEVAGTRLGTILVGAEPEEENRPDLLAANADEVVTLLNDMVSARRVPGYFGELITTLTAQGKPLSTAGSLLLFQKPLREDLADNTAAVALGRYFPDGEARHDKHQLTQRLLRLKRSASNDITDSDPMVYALSAALSWVHDARRRPVDTVTRVPPRPGKRDPIGAMVERACLRLDQYCSGSKLRCSQCLALHAIRSVRDYAPQKFAGGLDQRRLNVAGAFESQDAGVLGHVVLIDDIITTGSTAAECASVLLSHGAAFVTVVALAKNQRIIESTDSQMLKCSEANCEGSLRLKFNRLTNSAFWGCSEWNPSDGCRGTLPWEVGLRQLNWMNTKDFLDDSPDVPF